HVVGKIILTTVEGIARLGPARRQAPLELRRGLRDGWGGQGADEPRAASRAGGGQKFATIHDGHMGIYLPETVRLSRTALKLNARLQLRRRSRVLAVAKPIGNDAVILHLRRRRRGRRLVVVGSRAGWSPAL